MEPAIYDLDFTQDNDYAVQITFVDVDDEPIDMTDQTFTGRIKEEASSVSYTAWAVVDTDADVGVVVFGLTDDQTALLPDVCQYELRMTDASGTVTFQAGAARIRRSLFV